MLINTVLTAPLRPEASFKVKVISIDELNGPVCIWHQETSRLRSAILSALPVAQFSVKSQNIFSSLEEEWDPLISKQMKMRRM